MTWRDSPLGERVRFQAARLTAWTRRIQPTALGVRLVVFVSGCGGLLLAPLPVRTEVLVIPLVLLAALAAGSPGSGWATAVEITCVLGVGFEAWLGAEVSLWTVAGVAVLLYVHHTAAALGAQLRTDALVPRTVLVRWSGRTGAVLLGSAGLGLGAATLPAAASGWPAVGLTAVAVVSALVAVGTLAYLARARRGVRGSGADG